MYVINYDMTPHIDEYIHRIGRTARVGTAGLATSFFNGANTTVTKDQTKVLILVISVSFSNNLLRFTLLLTTDQNCSIGLSSEEYAGK